MEAQPHFPDHRTNSQLDKFGQFSPNVAAMEVQPYAQDMTLSFQLDKFGQCSPNVGSLEFDPYAQDMRAKSHIDKFGQFHMKYLDKPNGLRASSKERVKCPSSNVTDYSDPYALRKHLECLGDGEYGSVTKEYEEVHAQWIQLRNLLTSAYPTISISDQSSISQQIVNLMSSNRQNRSSISQGVIDLDIDCSTSNADVSLEAMHEFGGSNTPCLPGSSSSVMYGKITDTPYDLSDHHKNKDGMDSISVIVLDSDEDNDGDRIENKHASNSEAKAVRLESQTKSLNSQKKQMRQGCDVPGNGSTCGNMTVDANWLFPSPYQKVVLSSVDGTAINDVVPMIEFRPMDSLLQSSNSPNHKTYQRSKQRRTKRLKVTEQVKTPYDNMDSGKEHDANAELNPYVDLQDDIMTLESHRKVEIENDGLTDMWKEMTLAMEFSKDAASDNSVVEKGEIECDHSCFLKDDLGYVCRICGVIQKSIETIFDYQWIKGTRSTRTYVSETRSAGFDQAGMTHFSRHSDLEHELIAAEISVHPRHMKQMKPHQLEGFNFLLRNLVTDKPGGCIMAHAPGSGKTFMIISFIQSFLAKYPHARPLVVLPKGILSTWKKEFQRWQVEDIPLLDFYSAKADNRSQQLEVLENWVEHRSILFLGYKQFANIVCGSTNDKIAAACQERLLTVPTLLILDEGHTPRNENTDVLHSLAKVKTPRKVVLSGTLFQNHVREVFNILNLVRPKFLKLETSRSVVRRVLSRVNITGGSRRQCRTGQDTTFFDLVEETLQNDEDFKRKITVIQDLREMTNNVLHYYKGDFLEELPGLVDFTVLLNLTPRQKELVKRLKHLEKFKRSSVGSAVYMHPNLKDISENAEGDKKKKNAVGDRGITFNDEKIGQLVEKMDVRDGVKTKFFLNILGLSESAGEKLLVFSQYLLPLKFLERVLINFKGWSPGKEIFMISGDSNSEHREWSMDQFNNSPDAKVFFGSIKACGEGISLVGASRILILDVHLNPSVTRQAIGRAFRPGQLKKVYAYRLIAADSPEETDHNTSFRKELISKMWFEWSELCGSRDFEMEEIDINDSEDLFLESPLLGEDVKLLYKR